MTALAKLSSLEQTYSRARENFGHIVGYLDSKETSGMTHSELERELEKNRSTLITAVPANAMTRPLRALMGLYGLVCGFRSESLRRCLEPYR